MNILVGVKLAAEWPRLDMAPGSVQSYAKPIVRASTWGLCLIENP